MRRLIPILVAFAGALGGCSLGAVEGETGPDGDALAAQLAAQAELDLAIAAAPYPVRLPLADDFQIIHASWIDEPGDPARHGFSLDVRYLAPGDATVHVFQTNVSAEDMGEADPATLPEGQPLMIGGAEWSAVTLPTGDGTFNTQIARRFDGITLTIDGPSVELVTLAAESLAEVGL